MRTAIFVLGSIFVIDQYGHVEVKNSVGITIGVLTSIAIGLCFFTDLYDLLIKNKNTSKNREENNYVIWKGKSDKKRSSNFL